MRQLILVVEDDDTLRLLTTKQLFKLGFIGDSASDGLDALNKVRQDDGSKLILMDVQMPKMDGIEATVAIRQIEQTLRKNCHVPIIAMTANPDRERCLEAGMDDFIFKPVMLEQLKDLLARWLPAPAPDRGRKTATRRTRTA
ncbi:MAG: response regulator [Terriglobales bacterium]